jgi:hypothetical protein
MRLAKVLEDWARRQSKFESVRYVVSGQTTFAMNTWVDERGRPYNPPRPSSDFVGNVRWDALLDFTAHRSRWEVDEESYVYEPQEGLQRVLRLNVCDGKVAQNSRPRLPDAPPDDGPVTPANLDMTIVRGNLSTVIFPGGSLPLFHGHGIVPTSEDPLYAGHLRRDLDAEQFYVHGTGAHGGRQCLVLRTEILRPSIPSFHEFWVDTARQSAIVRYAYYRGGEVAENYDVHYQESRDGWMPASWAHTVFVRRATHSVRELQVVSREVSLPLRDQDFRLEVRAGMKVRQVERGQSGSPGAMGPVLSDTMQVAGASFVPAVETEKGLRRFLSWWLGAVLAALAVAAVLFWIWKGRRTRRGQMGDVSG